METSLDARVTRKVAYRVVPFVMLLYFIAFIDRVNIGFAALTMNRDLGLSPDVFGLGAGIFFLGYFLLEVPSNLALHKFGARIWIARVMITWGLVSAGMVFVKGATSFYVLRFLLGAAEAGFFPGIILYLGYWFPARRRAAMTALFMAAAPLSTVLGSPVSGAILGMHGLFGLAGWQWLFLLEAAPALVFGVVTVFYLTDRPEKATWLDEDERAWLVEAMATDQKETAPGTAHGVWRGLADPRVVALSLVYFGTSAGLYTLGIWAPGLIRQFGLSVFQIGFVNAIPAIFAVVAMVLWARDSDTTGERTWHVVGACLLASAGLVFAGYATSVLAIVVALTLVNIGISAAKPPLWSMPTLFLAGPAAAAGIATINSIGNLGGFRSTNKIGFIKQASGGYRGGLLFVAGLLLVSALVTLALSFSRPGPARRPNPAAPDPLQTK